jgi:hypothetical protein
MFTIRAACTVPRLGEWFINENPTMVGQSRSYTLRDNSERPCKLESVHSHTTTRTNRLIAMFMCAAIT